jgi:hypothetical protein
MSLEDLKTKVEAKKKAIKEKKQIILDSLPIIAHGDLECHEFKKVIPVDFGVGIRVKHDGKVYTTKAHAEREIYLDIRSWIGTSVGAIHYYGTLSCDGIYIGDGNVIFTSDIPKEYNLRTIVLTRPITEEEAKDGESDTSSRWYGFKAGRPTRCFDHVSEIIERSNYIVNNFFPDWKYTPMSKEDIEYHESYAGEKSRY